MRQPFARVALGHVRLCRQLGRRHGTLLFKRLVEAELVAHPHQRRAEHTAEIAQNFANESVQLGLVHHGRLLRLTSEFASSLTTCPRRMSTGDHERWQWVSPLWPSSRPN